MGGVHRVCGGAVVLAALLHAGSAVAQSADEARLDALIDATESDAGALAAARRQASEGDLTGAAATLERSLLLRSGSGSDDVRLYYAVVLCRLGDYRRGAYQIANVRNAAAEGWSEARVACAAAPAATAAPRGDSLTGVLTLGLAYETDALGSLTTLFEFPGFPAPEEEGIAVVGTGAVDARFASRLSGHGYAGASAQFRSEISGPDTDYSTVAGRVGYAFRLRGEDRQLAAGVVARYSTLDGDELVTEYGVQTEYQVAAGSTGRWAVRLEGVHQDYNEVGFGSSRDGAHYEFSSAYRSVAGINRAWTAGLALELKEAEVSELGYVGGRVFAAAQRPISESGAYVAASGLARHILFEDGAFSTDQTETRTNLRVAVGMPLNNRGLYAEAAASHSARWYDDASFLHDYSSFGVEVRLVYRFGLSRSPQ